MSAAKVVRSHPDGALLTVWVVPGAKRTEVVGYHGDALRVRVAAAPERGRANKAVIVLLEGLLGSRIRLAGGAGSRRKRFVVVGVTPNALVSQLEQLGN
jgi:uncharacterized protein (TIGR00251 family)